MDQTEIQKIKQDFFEFENETVGMKQELILKRVSSKKRVCKI